MPNRKLMLAGLTLLTFAVAGCTNSAVTTRSYVMEKERVDQQMESGNYGYLSGTPVPEDRSDIKKTRQIFVFEVVREDPEEDLGPVELPPRKKLPDAPAYQPPADRKVSEDVPSWAKPIEIPPLDETPPAATTGGSSSYVDYEVQKSDTLQKIAKKFYNSYSKWPRIQKANEELISDPNKIKPGMVLRIPVDE